MSRRLSAACRSLGSGISYRSTAAGARAAAAGSVMLTAEVRGSTHRLVLIVNDVTTVFVMSPPQGLFWNSAICPPVCPSVCLSVPWRCCSDYRHAGCLQLSHRRPPEMDGRRSAATFGSNCHRRRAYRLAARGKRVVCIAPHPQASQFVLRTSHKLRGHGTAVAVHATMTKALLESGRPPQTITGRCVCLL